MSTLIPPLVVMAVGVLDGCGRRNGCAKRMVVIDVRWPSCLSVEEGGETWLLGAGREGGTLVARCSEARRSLCGVVED